jgi:eukaryotic-like serine/threonine-protein kinase
MALPVTTGDVIGGKYTIEALIGVGGMGAVFLAKHEQLRRRVAVKFLLSEARSSPDAYARFEREAHAAAALQSENVARVIDMGALPDGTPYIVMEYLEGQDLSARLESSGRLAIDEAVAHVVEACDAVGEAHALGIIHRDLKPANLFLARRPNGTARVKVLDFGISKMNTAGKPMSLTGTGAVMGSPLYMSPEQLRGSAKVDERTDIWALGVVLYELLGGKPPFQAEAFPEQCALILTASPAPLRTLRPDVPPALEAVVMRCLSKDANERFSSVGELTAALLSAKSGRASMPATIRDVVVPPMNHTLQQPPPVPAAERFGSSTSEPVSRPDGVPGGRRSLGVGIALGFGAIGVICGLVGTFALRRSRPNSASVGLPSPAVSTAAAASPIPSPPQALIPPPPPPAPAEPLTGAIPGPSPVPPPALASSSPRASHAPARPPGQHGRGPSSPPGSSGGQTAPAGQSAPSPAAPQPAGPDCSTPFYFDSQGNKVFKQDCLK